MDLIFLYILLEKALNGNEKTINDLYDSQLHQTTAWLKEQKIGYNNWRQIR